MYTKKPVFKIIPPIAIDMAIYIAYIINMKIANIADLKNHLSSFLSLVEAGEEIEVRKRNIPIARVIPVKKKKENKTVLGCGKGSVKIFDDLTETLIPQQNWEMLK